MRKIVTGAALALAMALLAGCGSDGGSKPAADKTGDAKTKPQPQPHGTGGEAKHTVTLEVLGTGSAQVYYNLDSNKFEQVTLPWKKTSTITLSTDAEKRIGLPVSVTPGSVPAPDGTLRAADCVITVDGKKVAEQKGSRAATICKYTVR
ncbi:hypothetical protein [Streptomyces chrestomyceticus]|uniref:hypothetical protein n=1 Tax=Streptomyces chrestomyceticus TaxID=68185 RepID=UPI00379655F1